LRGRPFEFDGVLGQVGWGWQVDGVGVGAALMVVLLLLPGGCRVLAVLGLSSLLLTGCLRPRGVAVGSDRGVLAGVLTGGAVAAG
jgi:hypothetical protein